MIIGLDIDDTITDTFGVMFAYAEKFTIENLKREITYIIITLSPFIQFNRFTEETTYENQN